MRFDLRPVVLAGALALPAASAMAACGTPSMRVSTVPALTALLEGNTVCVPATNQPVMNAQEEHRAGGALWDYKRGPSHAVDPSKRIGSWAVVGELGRNAFVRYDYGSGRLYNQDGTYSFCSLDPEVVVRIKTGLGPC